MKDQNRIERMFWIVQKLEDDPEVSGPKREIVTVLDWVLDVNNADSTILDLLRFGE